MLAQGVMPIYTLQEVVVDGKQEPVAHDCFKSAVHVHLSPGRLRNQGDQGGSC